MAIGMAISMIVMILGLIGMPLGALFVFSSIFGGADGAAMGATGIVMLVVGFIMFVAGLVGAIVSRGGGGSSSSTSSPVTNVYVGNRGNMAAPPPQYAAPPPHEAAPGDGESPGSVWLILPIFFGIAGGLIPWYRLRATEPRTARWSLIIGTIVSLAWLALLIAAVATSDPTAAASSS